MESRKDEPQAHSAQPTDPKARYEAFCAHALGAGVLSEKEKALIAAAVAAVSRSPQAQTLFRERARQAGARAEEIAEAEAVAAVQGGGTQIFWMKDDFDQVLGEHWRRQCIPEADRAFWAFKRSVFEAGVLDRRLKELTAVAVSSMLRCRHCTNVHLRNAQVAGATTEEIGEALGVLWAVGTASFMEA